MRARVETAAQDAEHARTFSKRVVYLVPSFNPYSVPIFEELARHLGENFIVVALRRHPTANVRSALKMGSFSRRLLRGGYVNLSRHHDRGKETPFGLTWAPSLPLVLATLHPDVVISINFNVWTLTSLAMSYPTVIFWEGTEYTERTVDSWRKRLRVWMTKRAKAFVVNGALARHYLRSMGAADDRITEGGLCSLPPPGHSRRGAAIASPSDTLRFLFVGQMIDRKGVSHLLHSTRLLKNRLDKNARFELVLLGDGPERTRYEELAGNLSLDGCVRFVRAVEYDEVWDFYARAHVFVLPTVQDNWPLVVPEAMSMGLPVLLSKYAGSVPDLIRDGENGFVFDPEDHDSLAASLERYVMFPGLVQQHGSRSIQIVSAYNPQRAARELLWAAEQACRPKSSSHGFR